MCRVEEISPFPYKDITELTRKYCNAKLVWGQEEHWNAGAWGYVQQRFNAEVPVDRQISYVGRAPSGAPASGFVKKHEVEFKKLMADAIAKDQ